MRLRIIRRLDDDAVADNFYHDDGRALVDKLATGHHVQPRPVAVNRAGGPQRRKGRAGFAKVLVQALRRAGIAELTPRRRAQDKPLGMFPVGGEPGRARRTVRPERMR